MSKAARLYRESNDRVVPSVDRSWSLSPGSMLGAIIVGVGLLLVLSVVNWQLMQQNQSNMSDRLAQIENRLAQLSTKVEQVGTRAAAPAQRGPDPNRVYTVKTDGAPFKGARDAPVTIAEFSDYQ
jgi:protein-disulfide isomerase